MYTLIEHQIVRNQIFLLFLWNCVSGYVNSDHAYLFIRIFIEIMQMYKCNITVVVEGYIIL